MKLFDMMARCFANEGVRDCFALLGDANMNFATRLSETGCRMIYVRHEHCAAAAAMAYARKTGEPGVATVTCGPGLTQLTTALPAAVRARLPMVILAGEAPLRSGWYNQAIDQAPLIAATGAAYHSLHWPARTPIAIRDAFLQARRERRPIVLGVPFDMQNDEWAGDPEPPSPSTEILPTLSPQPPHPDDAARAAALIAASDRIIVVAGLGAVESGAGPACRTFAERLDALLATTLPARGLFHDDPFNLNVAGGFSHEVARARFAEADLVIVAGGSLARHNSDGGALWPHARLLHIDVDPVAVAQGRVAADAHLRGDARLSIEALIDALPQRPTRWRTQETAAQIAEATPDSTSFPKTTSAHDPRDVVAALDAAIPLDWQLVNSSGHCSFYFAQMPRRPNENFLTIREFGAIGNGISFAIGTAVARPESTVVLFDGDGSLLMHVQELETIARHRLNIVIVVMNDGAYGSEIHKLRADGLSDAGAVFGRTDFAAIARGFGVSGAEVNDLADVPGLVAAVSESGGAAVWDAPVDDRVYSPVIARAHPTHK